MKEEWYVSSNQESGEGYSDILVETENSETVILIEVKYANDGNLDKACERALQQIEEKKYDEEFRENGVDKIRDCMLYETMQSKTGRFMIYSETIRFRFGVPVMMALLIHFGRRNYRCTMF